jgi:hypothetical protein
MLAILLYPLYFFPLLRLPGLFVKKRNDLFSSLFICYTLPIALNDEPTPTIFVMDMIGDDVKIEAKIARSNARNATHSFLCFSPFPLIPFLQNFSQKESLWELQETSATFRG